MSINTFKVRDGRIRVYKKYVYKYVPFFSGLALLRTVRSCSIFPTCVSTVSISREYSFFLTHSLALFFFLSPSKLSLCFPVSRHSLFLSRAHFFLLFHSNRRNIRTQIQSRPMLRIYHCILRHAHHRNIIIVIIINIHSIRDNSSDNNDNILHVK